MKNFLKPIQLKNLTLASNIIYAPLAGCSDFVFRKMSARYKPALMFCEMVKMEALLRKVPGTYEMLQYSEEMRPIGAQICGSHPHLAIESARIIEDMGFDVIDLNCGCPVDKVTKDGSGSAMLKTPEKIGETIANMVASVKIPVTLKIRAGWDSNSINSPQITEIARDAGASAIFIHGRTRAQAYQGPAKWEYITACKAVAGSMPVIGNGDVTSPEAAYKMFEETGCDGVLVARGTMGQPWIGEEIHAFLSGNTPTKKTQLDFKQALHDHFSLATQFKSEKGALIDMRKATAWYLKEMPGARDWRHRASKAATLDECFQIIMESYSTV